MSLEEILKNHIDEKEVVADGKLLAAVGLITIKGNKELKDAELLLAQTTKTSAKLLARTTEASAAALAQTTENSSEELKKINEVSLRWMKWLTIALLTVGLVQIIVAVITLFKP